MKCDSGNRLKVKRGFDLPQSKLNEKLVRQIRSEYEAKQSEIKRLNAEFSAKALAKLYGVHYRTMEKVISYETWKHA